MRRNVREPTAKATFLEIEENREEGVYSVHSPNAVRLSSASASLQTSLTMNTLYYGDNLEVLRKYVRDETIDL